MPRVLSIIAMPEPRVLRMRLASIVLSALLVSSVIAEPALAAAAGTTQQQQNRRGTTQSSTQSATQASQSSQPSGSARRLNAPQKETDATKSPGFAIHAGKGKGKSSDNWLTTGAGHRGDWSF
jgi:hypothetical protein